MEIFEASVIILNLLAMPREELNYTALDAKEEEGTTVNLSWSC